MTKKYLPYLFSLVFIQNFIISSISNFSTNSLYIKIISGLLTFTVIFTNYPLEVKKLVAELIRNRILSITLILFVAYMTISLSWSANQEFGLLKIIHFLVGNIPLIISLYLVIINDEIKKGLIKSIIIVGVITGIISLILNPFYPTLPYSFNITRWSHVVFGRFSGLAFLVAILLLHKQNEKKQILVFSFISILIFISLIFSGYRSGIIGVIFSIVIYCLIVSIKVKDLTKNLRLVFITGAIITISIAIAYIMNFNNNSTRFDGIVELILQGNSNDGTINSRLEAYSTGIKMFTAKPIFGQGIGGFNNKFMETNIGVVLKYPHNILVEFLCELGLVGFGLVIIFIGAIIRKMIEEKEELLVFFIYGIFLAMFGKDISSNSLVWLFVGVGLLGRIRVEGHRL